ncbi:hypothetical protein B7O87_01455 [Cylindrospermopsis raciborskii CENA303]|uniref:Glutathione S-transferase n=1 Tax=Cylindrospermopsis raciborskii CENA303 TaxID=1170769 RepID=A0A1X4GJ27_9CYAN|nr:hypothetical protein [Cylindrospermopsis raciborskii]OSO97166.1 hypothetical protein B7O87_01455 [Cylindrospermopsis raciborskii CENA303]
MKGLPVKFQFVVLGVITAVIVGMINHAVTIAVPPLTEDIPEEILRTEIITIGRSPIDGRILTASEYAELQEQLRTIPPRKLSPSLRHTVFLLRMRRILLQIFPFLDI